MKLIQPLSWAWFNMTSIVISLQIIFHRQQNFPNGLHCCDRQRICRKLASTPPQYKKQCSHITIFKVVAGVNQISIWREKSSLLGTAFATFQKRYIRPHLASSSFAFFIWVRINHYQVKEYILNVIIPHIWYVWAMVLMISLAPSTYYLRILKTFTGKH